MIRDATMADLPSICALGQEVNLLHHDAWPEIFAGPSDPERDRTLWAQSIDGPQVATFVEERFGEVVAFITVSVVDESHSLLQPMRYARVGSVCVAANLRGQGIGRILMTHAEQWAFARGATDMRLNVWTFNRSAMDFYAELGYVVRSQLLGKPLAANAI